MNPVFLRPLLIASTSHAHHRIGAHATRHLAHGHNVARLGSQISRRSSLASVRPFSVEALHNINLEIPTGGYVALTEPSGTGKSTVGHLVAMTAMLDAKLASLRRLVRPKARRMLRATMPPA